MDVREKLVEIIQNSVGGCARHWAEVIADGLIAHGVTVQEWISVDDRLPEHGDDERSDCWIDDKWTFGKNTITHWCYLFQPPKGE